MIKDVITSEILHSG